jgi:hypothetical protein
MYEDLEEQAAEQRYHFEDEAEQDYNDLIGAKPELRTQVDEDLNYIGQNPQTGVSLERVDESENRRFAEFSEEQLERLRASRVYKQPEQYSIYWIVKTTDNNDPYPAIWWIDWHPENQGSVAATKVVLDVFSEIKKAISSDS